MTPNADISPSSPRYAPIDGIARVTIVIMIVGVPVGVVSRFFGPLEIVSYLIVAVQVILLLIWFYRAYRNLQALGATELQFTPRWAIIWWFVPILNFWKPYQITVEIIKSSDPSIGSTNSSDRSSLLEPPLVLIWWIYVFIGMAIAIGVALGSGPLAFRATVSGVNDSISTLLAILLIREITKRQAKKIAVLRSGGYG
jgi:hypothetical protein